MLQIIPSPHKNVVVVKATGLLTDDDYNVFVPKLEELIREQGPISVMVEFENFKGWEPKALWADFKLGLEHPDDFRKMAIVGEKAWHHLFAVMVKPFTSGEVRYFGHDQIQEAWDWILENKESSEPEQSEEEDDKPEDSAPATVTPYSRIVVAMDFSRHAVKALARAVELAEHYRASVAVVHACESLMRYDVYPDDFLGPSPSLPMYDPELDQQLFDSAKKRLEDMAAQIEYDRITVEVVWGSPSATVISYAESQNADLIVAGSHGRKGIAKLLGSTATSIMHSARCDVLVVRLD
jgi:universal stress protein A